jgi:hypothetical protein
VGVSAIGSLRDWGYSKAALGRREMSLVLDIQYVMQRTNDVVAIVGRGSRWGLAWICALAMASILAYGLTTAVSGGAGGSASQKSVPAVQTSVDPERSRIAEGCAASVASPMYAGVDMDSSIVAESRLAMCERVAP